MWRAGYITPLKTNPVSVLLGLSISRQERGVFSIRNVHLDRIGF